MKSTIIVSILAIFISIGTFIILLPRVEVFETTTMVTINRKPGNWSGYVNTVIAGTENITNEILLYTGGFDIKAGKYETCYSVEYVYNTYFGDKCKTQHIIHWIKVDGIIMYMDNPSWADRTWTIPPFKTIALCKKIDWIK